MEIKDLVKISTYARKYGLSVQAIYKKINRKDLVCIEIDGVKFVKIK